MDRQAAISILNKLPGYKVAVVGDYCLDKYVHVDPALEEISRETGRAAHQVTHIRTFPGAAGTVCANLASLGFGVVHCYGAAGDDGDGYELRRGLSTIGCGCENLLATSRLTNTYMKPLDTDMRELDRMDFRTRAPVGLEIQNNLLDRLEAGAREYNALVIVDQFDTTDEGLISGYFLEKLGQLAKRYPDIIFYADSRARPTDFAGMTVKCNHIEAALSAGLEPDERNLAEIARKLLEKTKKPAYITCGEKGIISVTEKKAMLSPAFRVDGPIDIVGAGDAASGGIVAALCTGALPEEAAFFANLVSSITIRKIGVTGTASPDEITRGAAMLEGLTAVNI